MESIDKLVEIILEITQMSIWLAILIGLFIVALFFLLLGLGIKIPGFSPPQDSKSRKVLLYIAFGAGLAIAGEGLVIGVGYLIVNVVQNKSYNQGFDSGYSRAVADEVVHDVLGSDGYSGVTPRYDMEFDITDEILMIPEGDTVIRRSMSRRWVYKNYEPDPIQGVLPIWLSLDLIPGLKLEDILEEFRYGAEEGTEVSKEDLSVTLNGQQIAFTGSFPYTIPGKGEILVRARATYLIPFDDRLVCWFQQPVKNVCLTYKHPKEFNVSLYAFGLELTPGKIRPTKSSTEGQTRYVLPGWFVKHQGFILEWR